DLLDFLPQGVAILAALGVTTGAIATRPKQPTASQQAAMSNSQQPAGDFAGGGSGGGFSNPYYDPTHATTKPAPRRYISGSDPANPNTPPPPATVTGSGFRTTHASKGPRAAMVFRVTYGPRNVAANAAKNTPATTTPPAGAPGGRIGGYTA